ncbi:uncharacterized protein DS421_11g326820 [Arachis hypogaea]|nr:uncharacterized protein DS421_11g326820 [Arachis hypogaea]
MSSRSLDGQAQKQRSKSMAKSFNLSLSPKGKRKENYHLIISTLLFTKPYAINQESNLSEHYQNP